MAGTAWVSAYLARVLAWALLVLVGQLLRCRVWLLRSAWSRPPPHLPYLNQLAAWSLDVVTAVMLACVVACVQASPLPVAVTWTGVELAFFCWATAVRLQRLDALGSAEHSSGASGRHGSGGTGGGGSGSVLLARAQQLFSRLLDEQEGALALLQRYPHHLRNWFLGEASHLGTSHLADLLDHLLLQGRAKHALRGSEGDGTLLLQLASELATRLGASTEETTAAADGRVGNANPPTSSPKPMAVHDDPLMACYRPLLFYVLMELVAAVGHLSLTLRMGFKLAATNLTATYYVKQGASSEPPLVFLHGIGLGLAPYLAFLSRLSARTNRTVIAVQYKHVSMRLTHHVPSASQVADDVRAFLDAQGITSAGLIAHSYGTLVASALVKRSPRTVATLTLLDPVCFAMFLPHLVRNALYFHVGGAATSSGVTAAAAAAAAAATPTKRRRRWALRSLLKGVVVRDVHVAAALSRNSHWADVNLWPTDLPTHAPTTVVLCGADHLVPVEELTTLLSQGVPAERGVRLRVHPGRGHGAFVLHPDMQDEIITGLGGLSAAQHAAQLAAAARVSGSPRRATRTALAPLERLSRAAAVLAAATRRLQECLGGVDAAAALLGAPGVLQGSPVVGLVRRRARAPVSATAVQPATPYPYLFSRRAMSVGGGDVAAGLSSLAALQLDVAAVGGRPGVSPLPSPRAPALVTAACDLPAVPGKPAGRRPFWALRGGSRAATRLHAGPGGHPNPGRRFPRLDGVWAGVSHMARGARHFVRGALTPALSVAAATRPGAKARAPRVHR